MTQDIFVPRLTARRRWGHVFTAVCLCMTLFGAFVLTVLIASVLGFGGKWLSVNFLTAYPSQMWPEESGIKSALFGTLWLMGLTTVCAVPLGMGAAIYLHEYATQNRLTRFIELNIANLAGVPSIIYGILGLTIFVRYLHPLTGGRSVLAGALTLSLLVLPIIIIASREALAAVPESFRQAAYAVGATRWQTIWSHVLPPALPGMMTGVILALSRAIGEAAPLIVLGALTWLAFVPTSPKDPFVALPIQIFNWADQADPVFQELAGAAIIVLLGILLPMNAIAVGIRAWHQRAKAW